MTKLPSAAFSSGSGTAGRSDLTALVSVVVCARNASSTLADTLTSIVTSHPREIVVVDDRSRDDTAEVARRFTQNVVPSPGTGLAAARQFGADQTSGEYIAFIDADVVLADGCLATLTAELEADPAVACVSARTVQSVSPSRWVRARRELVTSSFEHRTGRTNSVGLRASVFRREALMAIRFDPFFVGAAEDWDLAIRLRAAGWQLQRSSAVCYHRDRATLRALLRQRLWYGRGDQRLKFKHGPGAHTRREGRPGPHERIRMRQLARQGRLDAVLSVLMVDLAFRVGGWLERFALRNERRPRP